MKLGPIISSRRVAPRLAAVDAYEFPSGVRQRVRFKHPDLGAEGTALVEKALRQWFRLLARRPSVRLSMPSMLVDDMWHEFLLHTRDYAAFCDAVLGQFLHHEPESAMTPDQAAANRSDRLLVTLRLARQDEDCGPRGFLCSFGSTMRWGWKAAVVVTAWTAEGEAAATSRHIRKWCACSMSLDWGAD